MRFNLITLEPTHSEARILRHSLDELIDQLEIRKEYYWLEKNVPGPNFREGVARFYESEKVVLGALIADMNRLNYRLIPKEFRWSDPYLYSTQAAEALEESLRHFTEWSRHKFDDQFWTTFDRKNIIIEVRPILTSIYFEFTSKMGDYNAVTNSDQ